MNEIKFFYDFYGNLYAGANPEEAIQAAKFHGHDAPKSPDGLTPCTAKAEILDELADMNDGDLLALWNEYAEAYNDPDMIIYNYGDAATYAEEMSGGDAKIAFSIIDRLYSSGEPYSGDYIQEGIYTKVGNLRDIIDVEDFSDLVDWIDCNEHGEFWEIWDAYHDAEKALEEYRESLEDNKEAATPCTE